MVKRVLTVLVVLALAAPCSAASVRALNIEEMMSLADRVFVGKVLEVRVAFDPALQRNARYTTFDVLRVVKGKVGATVTVKQLAGRLPGMTLLPVGLPAFQPGQELVLFLHGDSSLGYTSPVGLSQGQLPVRTAADGSKKVVAAFASGPILGNLKNAWVRSVMSKVEQMPRGGVGRMQAMDYGTFISTLDRLAKP